MLASQLIYTACGKDRTGAFGVWSKSADITTAEENEITQTMYYKRPPELSSNPTKEELAHYPKKYGYFRLSSGRCCIAQSTYTGEVYSELDSRCGNYLLHAFVVEDFAGLLPMTFIGSKLFKTELTYEEWHENPAPDDLPKIDLSEGINGLNKSDIDRFFTEERYSELEWLLQATINASASDEKVTFHDRDENLEYWYRAISLCLPGCLQKELTYCSMHTPVFVSPTTGMTAGFSAADVKIQNVLRSVQSGIFDYDLELRKGKYVYDFEAGKMNTDFAVSKYVRAVVRVMRENLFNTLMMVDAVDKLMQDNACSVDQAAALLNLRNGNYRWFDTLEELIETVKLAQKALPEDIASIADGLYEECVVNERWPYCPELLLLYRLVVDCSERADKTQIVEKYIVNYSAFGVSDALGYDEFVRELRARAPFPWADFTEYLFESSDFAPYFAVGGQSFRSQYTVYATLVDAMADMSDGQKDLSYKYLLSMMANVIKEESFEKFDVLLNGVKPLGEKWEMWIVKNALVLLARNGSGITDVCDVEFLLKLVARIPNGAVALMVLKMLVSEKATDETFARSYVAVVSEAPAMFESLETALEADPSFAGFVEYVGMLRFINNANPTPKDLEKYYKRFYKTGKDKGLFIRKFKEFLGQVPSGEMIAVCKDLYTAWFAALPDHHLDVMDCLSAMASAIFDLDFDYLVQYTEKKGMGAFEPILKRLIEDGSPVPGSYSVLKLGMDTAVFCAKGDPRSMVKSDLIRQLVNNTLYDCLKTQVDLRLFTKHYLHNVLYMYLEVTRQKDTDFVRVLEYCLSDLASASAFNRALAEAVDNLDKRAYPHMLADLFAYAYTESTELAKCLQRFIDEYLEDGGRGKRKKVFAVVEDYVRPACAKPVKRFIEDYQKEHQSFMDKIFGGIGKTTRPPKEEKTWNDDDKKHRKK